MRDLRCFSRVRNCTFLVANANKNFALATRISQLVASGRLTTLFLVTIITQTIALIFKNLKIKFKAALQLVTFFLPFRCLGSIKPISFYHKSTTMFYSYETVRSIAAMFFQRFPIAHILRAQEAPCVLGDKFPHRLWDPLPPVILFYHANLQPTSGNIEQQLQGVGGSPPMHSFAMRFRRCGFQRCSEIFP